MACSVKLGYLCGKLFGGGFVLPCFHMVSLDHLDLVPMYLIILIGFLFPFSFGRSVLK